MELPIHVNRKEVIAKNTFILALDGDIDFKPEAVLLLLDLMKKDEKLGAVCGRIHPTGSGKIERLFAILLHLSAQATWLQCAV
jgi:chitin synthase